MINVDALRKDVYPADDIYIVGYNTRMLMVVVNPTRKDLYGMEIAIRLYITDELKDEEDSAVYGRKNGYKTVGIIEDGVPKLTSITLPFDCVSIKVINSYTTNDFYYKLDADHCKEILETLIK